MGLYLQTPEPLGKAFQLAQLHGAEAISEPERFSIIPADKVLVCVIENPGFDAAAVAYCEEEYHRFKYDESGRPRTWLLMDRALVKQLAPDLYKPYL